jgi:hypothetical protein
MARTMRAVRRTHMDVRSANTPYAKTRAFFWLLFFARAKKSDSVPQGVKALLLLMASKAKALDSRFRGNDDQGQRRWIPAFAGMTSN